MNTELLRVVAAFYFKDKIGKEPDTLKFTYVDHGMREFSLEATLGDRSFDLWMCPGCNLIQLKEIHHAGTFAAAAKLVGLDRNLNNLKRV